MIESISETLCNNETTKFGSNFGAVNLLSGKKEYGMLGTKI